MSTFCPNFHNGNNQTEGWFLSISHIISPGLSTLGCSYAVRRINTFLAVLELVRCDWGCRLDLGCKWAWHVPSCDRSSCLLRSRSATSHFLPAGSLFISLTRCSDSHLSIWPKSWSETFTLTADESAPGLKIWVKLEFGGKSLNQKVHFSSNLQTWIFILQA